MSEVKEREIRVFEDYYMFFSCIRFMSKVSNEDNMNIERLENILFFMDKGNIMNMLFIF